MSQIIEEYKTLREELMLHMKLQRQALAFSGTAFFAILALLAKTDRSIDPEILGIGLLSIITPMFMLFLSESYRIAEIATYIEARIEPKVTGLEWTRLNAANKPGSAHRYGSSSFSSSAFTLPHAASHTCFRCARAIQRLMSTNTTNAPCPCQLVIASRAE